MKLCSILLLLVLLFIFEYLLFDVLLEVTCKDARVPTIILLFSLLAYHNRELWYAYKLTKNVFRRDLIAFLEAPVGALFAIYASVQLVSSEPYKHQFAFYKAFVLT